MTSLLILPLPTPALPTTPPGEAELIRARIASARHWRRRRRWLALRAALFGRRKHAGIACPGFPAAARTAC